MKAHLLLGLLALVMASCSKPSAETEAVNPAQHQEVELSSAQVAHAEIQLGAVTLRQLPHMVQATGIVDVPPTAMASIHVAVQGVVRNHKVLPGAHVHKGDVLCALEHTDIIQLQQDYLEAESKLAYLKQEYERQRGLEADNAGAAKRTQAAEADYTGLLARHRGLEAKLRLIGLDPSVVKRGSIQNSVLVRSPIDGFVKTVNVTQGKYVSPTDVLFELVDKRHMHLELKVFEKDAGTIAEGQLVQFTTAAMGTNVMKAHVFLTGKTFDAVQRTVNIHAHLDDEAAEKQLMPGMFVQAELATGVKPATMLPLTAIASEEDQHFVFVETGKTAKGRTFRRYPVKILRRLGEEAEVSLPETIRKDKGLVVKGAFNLQAAFIMAQEGGEE